MSQEIRRAEVPKEFSSTVISDNTVIVVLDVYMFSSTVITLHSQGIEEVIAVYDESELQSYKENGLLVGGENNRGENIDFDFSNSPQNVYATFGVMDTPPQRVALTSHNGAKRSVEAIEAVTNDESLTDCPILIGSSINAKSVAEYIQTEYESYDVFLLCAGSNGEATIEDVIGSLAISQLLRNEEIPKFEYEEILSMLPAGKTNDKNSYKWLSEEDVEHISTLNEISIVSEYDFETEAFCSKSI